MSNSFGRLFRLTTFGESHGPALGGVIDGCPAGLPFDESLMRRELELRRPSAANPASTARREADEPRLLSGLFEGRTSGAPLAFVIENRDHNPADYQNIKDIYRPGHADYPWEAKYGLRDWRGGGRAAGRETAVRVAAGAVALALLRHYGVSLNVYTLALGGLQAAGPEHVNAGCVDEYAPRELGAPNESIIPAWRALVEEAKAQGESLGGLVRLEAHGLPAGLGEPLFDKLDARIGAAMFSVGAVKGVEIGAGFAAAALRGSQNNDLMLPPDSSVLQVTGQVTGQAGGQDTRQAAEQAGEKTTAQVAGPSPRFASNRAGGVLGGLSTGQPLLITVAVKPIPSLPQAQASLDRKLRPVTLQTSGRHDICAIPRINAVLKAMLALTLADFILLNKNARL